MIPAREPPLKAERVHDLVRLPHRNGHMIADDEERRIVQWFLSGAGLTDIAERTRHSQTTVLDVLARYRHANGDVLHQSKRNPPVAPRPLMEGMDYPDRASPFLGLFADREIHQVDLEKHGRWQDRLVYGG